MLKVFVSKINKEARKLLNKTMVHEFIPSYDYNILDYINHNKLKDSTQILYPESFLHPSDYIKNI